MPRLAVAGVAAAAALAVGAAFVVVPGRAPTPTVQRPQILWLPCEVAAKL